MTGETAGERGSSRACTDRALASAREGSAVERGDGAGGLSNGDMGGRSADAPTPEELRSFGLLMDRGSSFGKVCGLRLDDYRGFELAKDHIDDPLVLGSAIFSQWHRLTSSRTVNAAHDDVRWFSQAARRLREITE